MTEDEKKAYEQLNQDAQKYVFNIMNLGKEYSDALYKEKTDEIKKNMQETKDYSIFSNFDFTQKNINMGTLIQGYGNFGRKFIEEVFSQDSASALNMFEVVTQEYLDLKAAIEEQFQQYQQSLKESKETQKDS